MTTGLWVRADVVISPPECASLPVVTASEPVGIAAVSTSTALPVLSDTPTPTITPTLAATEQFQATVSSAVSFRGGNEDWRGLYPDGVIGSFDGVTMVLVPTGCFNIGAKPLHGDETYGNQVCFFEPFWIDRTEVTQADFSRQGGVRLGDTYFEGRNRPEDGISWFDARDFCAGRGGRLPTEAEWEYAARGPDEWSYPWGNDWDAANVVWHRSDAQGTADVGSLPAGASWVGALDMGGNVGEWTSSLYEPYPYDANDGRETNSAAIAGVVRVIRGGSWVDDNPGFLRSASRYGAVLDQLWSNVGFRCVRSNEVR